MRACQACHLQAYVIMERMVSFGLLRHFPVLEHFHITPRYKKTILHLHRAAARSIRHHRRLNASISPACLVPLPSAIDHQDPITGGFWHPVAPFLQPNSLQTLSPMHEGKVTKRRNQPLWCGVQSSEPWLTFLPQAYCARGSVGMAGLC